MKTQIVISLLATLIFSQNSFARAVSKQDGEVVEISSSVKAGNIVTIAVGNQAQSITQIGTLKPNRCKSPPIDIEVDNITQTTIGDAVLTLLELPSHDKNCN